MGSCAPGPRNQVHPARDLYLSILGPANGLENQILVLAVLFLLVLDSEKISVTEFLKADVLKDRPHIKGSKPLTRFPIQNLGQKPGPSVLGLAFEEFLSPNDDGSFIHVVSLLVGCSLMLCSALACRIQASQWINQFFRM